MTVKELESRVAVVHRCFSERGDSIHMISQDVHVSDEEKYMSF